VDNGIFNERAGPGAVAPLATLKRCLCTSGYGNLLLQKWKVQKGVGGVEKYFTTTTIFSGELWF